MSTKDRYGPALPEDTHGREKVFPLSELSFSQRLTIP